MKITKRQLRRIIKEEKARVLAERESYGPNEAERETNLDPGIAGETLEELQAEGAFDRIQNEVTTAATIIANLSDEMDIALMDAGLNELAMSLRKAETTLDKIRNLAYDLS